MQDGINTVLVSIGGTRTSLSPRLCHPCPWGRCQPSWYPHVGCIPKCEDKAPPAREIPTTYNTSTPRVRCCVFCASRASRRSCSGMAPRKLPAEPNMTVTRAIWDVCPSCYHVLQVARAKQVDVVTKRLVYTNVCRLLVLKESFGKVHP